VEKERGREEERRNRRRGESPATCIGRTMPGAFFTALL
jgi:hypothetical protein